MRKLNNALLDMHQNSQAILEPHAEQLLEYSRSLDENLFFVVAAGTPEECEKTLEEILELRYVPQRD